MLGRLLRLISEKLFGPLGKAVARTPITANMITVAGVVVTAIGCWYVAAGSLRLGGLILIAGSLTDTLDGPVAKAKGTAGQSGAFLDSTLDRLSDGLVLGSIAWFYAFNHTAVWAVTVGESMSYEVPIRDFGTADQAMVLPLAGTALALSALVLGFLTSYMRARAEGLGLDGSAGIAERAPRVIIVLAGLVFGVLIQALAVLVVLSAVTVVQRFHSIWKQARRAAPA